MSDRLKKGDTVAWQTSQGTTHGTVQKKLTRPTDIESHHVAASPDNPEYLVVSDKSGKPAPHKPDALKKKQGAALPAYAGRGRPLHTPRPTSRGRHHGSGDTTPRRAGRAAGGDRTAPGLVAARPGSGRRVRAGSDRGGGHPRPRPHRQDRGGDRLQLGHRLRDHARAGAAWRARDRDRRTAEKGAAACASVAGRATPVVLELGDFDSVVACADRIEAMGTTVDMLVCNAGIVLGGLEQVRGLEKQFVVNHLGHFLLVHRLLARVLAAPQGRVVVLGSGDHARAPAGGIQFDRLSGEGWADRGYSHSKLANGLFSLELARRLAGTAATSNCVTPGHTRTAILRSVGDGYRDDAQTPAQGAATPCYVAAHPDLAGVSGGYFRDCAPAQPSAQQSDRAMAARLWQVSEDLVRSFLKPAT